MIISNGPLYEKEMKRELKDLKKTAKRILKSKKLSKQFINKVHKTVYGKKN